MLRTMLLAGVALACMAGTAQAQISDGKVKIGVLNDRSGIYADLAGEGSAIAARMAAEEMGNAIDGKPIEIVVADHQNKADIAANTTREWIDASQVDVVADVPNSAAALAVQEITRDKKRIFLMSGPGSTDLSGKACSPYGFQWAYDNYAMAAGTGRALVEQGKKKWFILTADYAFGHSLENETAKMVKALGGEVVGTVRHPLATPDFSSYLLQAQASGADVIGLANAGSDATNAIKQAAEFGITQSGQSLAGLLLFITDVHALGPQVAQGLMLTTGFYWDRDADSRAWSEKFEKLARAKPTMVQAGVYSAVRHYLQAVKAAGTDDPDKVAAKMRETPVNDMFAKNGRIAANGRMFHDMYLARVRAPADSKTPWQYFEIVKTIPADQAFIEPAKSGCPLVKG
ncbi:ABC transporter substrate-binding protein [Arenibaculum pallidiluteum]|uniref:ABC transporter substrate-binding protein n=1 Tax=Arenibaculum pallidiluteum TaxID=2812559 RepID=UPI001A97BE88|nr:ABC transporter substrate-binding protein [Arenibaculum pallidiluteum]